MRTAILMVGNKPSKLDFLAIRYPGAQFEHGAQASIIDLVNDLRQFVKGTQYKYWVIYSPSGKFLAKQ